MLQIKWFHRTHLMPSILLVLFAAVMATPGFAAETTVDRLLQDQADNKRPILVFGADIDDKAVAQISALWSN